MKKLLFFILSMSLLASFGNQGWVKLYKLRNIERGLMDENRLLSEHNMTLLKEIDDLKDLPFLEHYLRQELGFVKDNEILYEMNDSPQTP